MDVSWLDSGGCRSCSQVWSVKAGFSQYAPIASEHAAATVALIAAPRGPYDGTRINRATSSAPASTATMYVRSQGRSSAAGATFCQPATASNRAASTKTCPTRPRSEYAGP